MTTNPTPLPPSDGSNLYRKRPVVITASQWFKHGDHPAVRPMDEFDPAYLVGFVKTLEGNMQVVPGDWIITGVKGEHYPCKPDIFALTYETVKNEAAPGGDERFMHAESATLAELQAERDSNAGLRAELAAVKGRTVTAIKAWIEGET
jgi:hypothetical protein